MQPGLNFDESIFDRPSPVGDSSKAWKGKKSWTPERAPAGAGGGQGGKNGHSAGKIL